MIDITGFANKMKTAAAPKDETTTAGRPALAAGDFPVTFRGVVYPWRLDHMDHMNVQHYVAMFDQASWVLLAWLGLDSQYFSNNRRGMAALEQTIRYKSELRAGDMVEIRSSVIEVRDKTLRLQHNMQKVNSCLLAAPPPSSRCTWTRTPARACRYRRSCGNRFAGAQQQPAFRNRRASCVSPPAVDSHRCASLQQFDTRPRK